MKDSVCITSPLFSLGSTVSFSKANLNSREYGHYQVTTKPQSTHCLTVIVRAQNLDSKIFDDCQNWEKQVMMGGWGCLVVVSQIISKSGTEDFDEHLD